LIERFEPYVYGIEIGNAYSELKDPIWQRELFQEQAQIVAAETKRFINLTKFLRAIDLGIPLVPSPKTDPVER
jgi:lysyl-tRNA synthetase class 2